MNTHFDVKRFFGFVLIIVIPLMTYNLENSRWKMIHKPIVYSAHTVIQILHSFNSNILGTMDKYLDLIGLKVQHKNLREQLALQKTRTARYESLRLENIKLRQALGLIENSPLRLELAEVLSFDALPDMRSIFLNKGLQHGVKKSMGIISESGHVVGYTIEVLEQSSKAILITDRYSVVDAITQRSRSRGLLEGRSAYSLKLKNLRRTDDVIKGDLIVTSPFGNMFPKGLPIGIVDSAENDAFNISKTIIVRPLGSLNKLERVLIIKNYKEDFMKNENPTE